MKTMRSSESSRRMRPSSSARGVSTSGPRLQAAQAAGLLVGETEFAVLLRDGRRLVVPFACFPRLAQATPAQRGHFEVYSAGKMLHWPDIDEDIEVQHLIDGRLPVRLAGLLSVS